MATQAAVVQEPGIARAAEVATDQSKSLNVLILSLIFPPDGVSTAHIMGDLAEDLRRRGHRVAALTTTPHYSVDEAARAAQPLTPRFAHLVFRSDFRGIPVWHVRMPGRKGSIARRSLAWLWFHVVAVILGRLLRPRPQIIIVPSPLLSVAVVAWLINLGRQAQYIYNVQELYPDLAINSGHLRNTWFIRLLRGLESFVYDRAAAVTTIGATMRERIASRAPGRQVRLIPNAADIDSMRPLPRDNDFARQHGLTDRIVVTYAGNMGLMQGLEDVLRAAKLAEAEAITFLFVGDGVVAANLRESARAQGLGNVKFLPQQPYVMVPQIYAASDVCLVPLIGAIASEAVPSKVARIMACARPALVIAPPESDLARLVRATGCGVVAAPGRPEDIARKVSDLAADAALRREMGERGRSHAIAHFSRAAVGNAYDELIRSLA